MSGSVNKVVIIGNLCADVEIRRTQAGKPIANMRVATSESWKDSNSGERKEKSEFHSVVIFNEGLCKVAEQYLKKGSKVYLEGSLATRKWQDQSGNDRYSTEVVLQGFNSALVMLDGSSKRDDTITAHNGEVYDRKDVKRHVRESRKSFHDDLNDELPPF